MLFSISEVRCLAGVASRGKKKVKIPFPPQALEFHIFRARQVLSLMTDYDTDGILQNNVYIRWGMVFEKDRPS